MHFVHTVQFQRSFLYIFPYLPEEQCTAAKSKSDPQGNMKETTRELATDCVLCVLYRDVHNFCSSLCMFAFKLQC